MKARTILFWLLLVAAGTVLTFLLFDDPTDTPIGTPIETLIEPEIPSEHVDAVAAYEQFYDAVNAGDTDTLLAMRDTTSGYVRYLVALALAESNDVSPPERLTEIELALDLRINDTLKRLELRELNVLHGAIAEEAGENKRAVDAYIRGFPDATAIRGVERLVPDSLERARIFANGNRHNEALEAVGNRVVPSIQAPALRALGRHEEALESYRAWLSAEPSNQTALLGEAWSLFSLDRMDDASEVFAALGPSGYYGLGLVENRRGNIAAAGDYLVRSGTVANQWLATTLYERNNMIDEALSVYMQIGAGTTNYADDAAFRAYVLANRTNNPFLAQQALDLLPSDNFFSQRLERAHYPVQDAQYGEVATVSPPAARLADTLAERDFVQAAQGELLFALREAEPVGDVNQIGALLIALQQHGEYRMSAQAAYRLLQNDPGELRWWQLAYPQAWNDTVRESAEEFDVEPSLVWAVMRQESAYSPVAVSTSNAQGLMQIVPSTWDWIAELLSVEPGEPFDPETNIRYGTKYLGWLLNYFDGDAEMAIASYNGGQGYVRRLFETELVGEDKIELFRHFDRIETREYLARVTEHKAVYDALYPNDSE